MHYAAEFQGMKLPHNDNNIAVKSDPSVRYRVRIDVSGAGKSERFKGRLIGGIALCNERHLESAKGIIEAMFDKRATDWEEVK